MDEWVIVFYVVVLALWVSTWSMYGKFKRSQAELERILNEHADSCNEYVEAVRRFEQAVEARSDG